MWNKKIVITSHAKHRFLQRHLTFSQKSKNVSKQILSDLRPLNVMKIEKIKNNHLKVTTNQGKVYILSETEDTCYVKTVYKTNIQYELALKHLSHEEIKKCKLSTQNQ